MVQLELVRRSSRVFVKTSCRNVSHRCASHFSNLGSSTLLWQWAEAREVDLVSPWISSYPQDPWNKTRKKQRNATNCSDCSGFFWRRKDRGSPPRTVSTVGVSPSSPKGDESLSPVDGHGSPPLLVLLTQGHLFLWERVVPAAERTRLSTGRAKNAGMLGLYHINRNKCYHNFIHIIIRIIPYYHVYTTCFTNNDVWVTSHFQDWIHFSEHQKSRPFTSRSLHSKPGLSTCETLNPLTDSNSDAGKTSSNQKWLSSADWSLLSTSNSTVTHRSSGLKHCEVLKEHRTELRNWPCRLCRYFFVWFPDPAFPHV